MYYEITFHGDLEGSSPIYESFEEALRDLRDEWCLPGGRDRAVWYDKFGLKHWKSPFMPDPEDDRVVIWEITPQQHRKAVWHFSGWHWSFDADDLPGGPLEQGTFDALGDIPEFFRGKSLYELAMGDDW